MILYIYNMYAFYLLIIPQKIQERKHKGFKQLSVSGFLDLPF